jgi:hypothetical protein
MTMPKYLCKFKNFLVFVLYMTYAAQKWKNGQNNDDFHDFS